ncbi:MAG TPA: pyrimidine reductase family protein [Streptosporangiaceae bacterium]|nr:pyrimidine reductase family protein [Streptosporangiaceae bacterium]
MSLRQLFSDAEPDLPGLYAYPDRRWLRANMVATADGAASLNGVTRGISSDTDRRVFALLRTLCDVILVGASTVREEKYKPARPEELWSHLRDGRPPTPPIAVVTRRLDLDPDSPLITAAPAHARTIVITTASAPAAQRDQLARHAEIVIAGQDTVDLAAAVDALAERGHRRMLTEGGPRLLAQLIEAGLVNELCLTIGPLLAGPGAGRIVAGTVPGSGSWPLRLAHVLEDQGFLLCRYTRSDAA